MRLINVQTMEMWEFVSDVLRYAALSHRWSDDEITFKDYQKKLRKDSMGYKKGYTICDFVREWGAQTIDWVWVDTVCIDTKSSAELSEAINSMYDWYWNADLCVAYLADVPARDPNTQPLNRMLYWMHE